MTFSNGPELAALCGKSRRQYVPTEVQRGLQDGPRDRNGNTRPVKTTKVVRSLIPQGDGILLKPGPGGIRKGKRVDDAQMSFVTIFPLTTPTDGLVKAPYLTLRLLIPIRPRMYKTPF